MSCPHDYNGVLGSLDTADEARWYMRQTKALLYLASQATGSKGYYMKSQSSPDRLIIQ